MIAIEVEAAVEGAAEILAAALRAEELVPGVASDGLAGLIVTKCEPSVALGSCGEGHGEDGIVEHALIAVGELHHLVNGRLLPVVGAAYEVVVLGNVHTLNLVGVVHHVDGHLDELVAGGHAERTVVAEVVAAVKCTLGIGVAVALGGAKELVPHVVVGYGVAGLIVADGKPCVALGGVEHDGEHGILIDVLAAVAELQRLGLG